jgi:hypothetical protein
MDQDEFRQTLGGRSLTFKLGLDALIELQEHLAVNGTVPTLDQIDRDYRNGRLKVFRGIVWAALREYHGDLSVKDVSRLIVEADKTELEALVGRLMATTRPDPEDVAALASNRPPTGQAKANGSGRQARKRAARAGGVTAISTPVAPA